MNRLLRVLGALSILLAAHAKAASAQSATLNAELLKDWLDMKTMIVKLANEMPAEKYSFKSTPAQRDFAQQVLHIAQANVENLRFLGGKVTPRLAQWNERPRE